MNEHKLKELRYQKRWEKSHVRFKRRMKNKFKGKEVLKYSPFQVKADKYAKEHKKKGKGKVLKEKGKVRPSLVCMNSYGKNWARIYSDYASTSLKEGFKFSFLWEVT